MVMLYSVSNKFGKAYGFEVAVDKIAKATPEIMIMGNRIPARPVRELYPSNEDFGTSAWFFQKREDAEHRFNVTLQAAISSQAL